MAPPAFRPSVRFYLGISFIILSLVMGKITTGVFLSCTLRKALCAGFWPSVVTYVISWPLLILGVYWVGREYYNQIRKYISYKFYHESLKRGTRKAVWKTRELKRRLGKKIRDKRLRKVERMLRMPVRR